MSDVSPEKTGEKMGPDSGQHLIDTVDKQGSLASLQTDSELFADHFDPDSHCGEDRLPSRKKIRHSPEHLTAEKKSRNKNNSDIAERTIKMHSKENILQVFSKSASSCYRQKNENPFDSIDMQHFEVPDIDDRVDTLRGAPDMDLESISRNTNQSSVTDILFGDLDEISVHGTEINKSIPKNEMMPDNLSNTSPPHSKSVSYNEITTGGDPDIESVSVVPINAPRTSHGISQVTPEKEFQSMMDEFSNISFFWIDAREVKHTNEVYFFGKVFLNEKWVSCCCRFQCIERSILVLPKKELDGGSENTLTEVAKELSDICRNLGINKRSFKNVYRWYSFEKENIPEEKTWWIKMKYQSADPVIPTAGPFRTFTHLFGTQQSMVEMILLKRKIMGPCWLNLKQGQIVKRKVSHCQVEFTLQSYKEITVEKSKELLLPPLKICSLSLISDFSDANKNNEIYGASLLTINGVEQEISTHLSSSKAKFWNAVRRPTCNYVFPFQIAEIFEKQNVTRPNLLYSEKALLESLLNQIHAEDPDVVVGHNFFSYHLDLLLHRLQHWNIHDWSKLGKLTLLEMPKLQSGPGGVNESSYAEKEVMAGRLVCDTYLLSKEYVKSSDYSLTGLVSVLGLQNMNMGIGLDHIVNFRDPDSERRNSRLIDEFQTKESIFSMLLRSSKKSVLAAALTLHLDIIPLTKRMTNISGNVWSRTLSGSRSERIEFLLLHKFHESKFVVPDKKIQHKPHIKEEDTGIEDIDEDVRKSGSNRRKPQYTGGMVLEPKRGLYNSYVLLLDFNSLYPSIIQEFNLCFTTLQRAKDAPMMERNNDAYNQSGPSLSDVKSLVCNSCEKEGRSEVSCRHRILLPRVLKELVEGRRQVKKLMQNTVDSEKAKRLNIRQKALKLIANSMYGCLGFQFGRFYAPAIAELVTAEGRKALLNATSLVSKLDPRLDVVYGDTDSVMINLTFAQSLPEVRQIAKSIKDAINKCYKTLEIDIDGVFQKLLLLRKKKYAALRIVDYMDSGIKMEREIKGLDLVRREWCPLSQQMCSEIIDIILSMSHSYNIGQSIQEYLKQMVRKIDEGETKLQDFIITKALNRDPAEYVNPIDHPHVCVAMRMKELNLSVQVGDLIPYIVCTENANEPTKTGKKLSTYCYHPQELGDTKLRTDLSWYKKIQLYTPIMRLLEYIPECDSIEISKVFGISNLNEALNLSRAHLHKSKVQKADELLDMPEIAFPDVRHLFVRCPEKNCRFSVDVLPHKYLLECALRCLQDTLDTQIYEEKDYPWLACPKCNAELSYLEVWQNLKIIHDELKHETQIATADYALQNSKQSSGYLSEPLFKQLGYFSSLFNFKSISKFLVAHLERSIAGREPNIAFLSRAYKAKGINPGDIAEKLTYLILQNVRRLKIRTTLEILLISQRFWDEMKPDDLHDTIDLYDDLKTRISDMQHHLHGYSIPIVTIMGHMR